MKDIIEFSFDSSFTFDRMRKSFKLDFVRLSGSYPVRKIACDLVHVRGGAILRGVGVGVGELTHGKTLKSSTSLYPFLLFFFITCQPLKQAEL